MSAMEIGLERQSSIEKEPRTLNIDQIQYAREAAMSVMNTRSIEEALMIFTKGLKPVVNCVGDECNEMNSGEDLDTLANELSISGFRDIVSAPF
ncbi:Hypothetical predicted protein [Olea europaea subsp. europaea]|uniref:Uncharacterized protein n=1 Tax=Olea europaea subsp. europaea TaxID=158383 RepID=A0A8S0QTZ2_OLEEU|nr:Hypothetical predicted protein [Olea europaea subsp. europaea]CAA2981068.1 Hypothetical predicted protein [Olea europaea subsp. europaea]